VFLLIHQFKQYQNFNGYLSRISDHTLGVSIPLASVALGACIIEKHFTLNKNMEGWDHKVSATKDEMKEIVDNSIRSFRITATESDEKKKEVWY
jgi:N-acetylneuraminate synthase